MKKAAIIPSAGIGDALIMMIAANYLHNCGYKVTIFHNAIISLQSWLPHYFFKLLPTDDDFLSSYDCIILQNDNSERIKELYKRYNHKKIHLIYPSYRFSKHGPLSPEDVVIDKNFSFAKGMSLNCAKLFNQPICSDIGIVFPPFLERKKYQNRVFIHPTSNAKNKNYSKDKYLDIAKRLKALGFHPLFSVSNKEREEWLFIIDKGFDLPRINTLCEMATYLYESSYFIGNDSGPSHLASYFSIPSIIIAKDKNQMKLWQPGWNKALLIFPPSWVFNLKLLRLREKKWQRFISVKTIISKFLLLTQNNS